MPNVTFKQFLAEALDKPYPFKWVHKRDDEWKAEFLAADDSHIEISIVRFEERNGKSYAALGFTRDGDQTKTNSGDSFRIFATVIAASKEFITEVHPNRFIFEAFKVNDEGELDPSRVKLYASICRRFAVKHGYDFKEESGRDVNKFVLTSKEQ